MRPCRESSSSSPTDKENKPLPLSTTPPLVCNPAPLAGPSSSSRRRWSHLNNQPDGRPLQFSSLFLPRLPPCPCFPFSTSPRSRPCPRFLSSSPRSRPRDSFIASPVLCFLFLAPGLDSGEFMRGYVKFIGEFVNSFPSAAALDCFARL